MVSALKVQANSACLTNLHVILEQGSCCIIPSLVYVLPKQESQKLQVTKNPNTRANIQPIQGENGAPFAILFHWNSCTMKVGISMF